MIFNKIYKSPIGSKNYKTGNVADGENKWVVDKSKKKTVLIEREVVEQVKNWELGHSIVANVKYTRHCIRYAWY